MQKKFHSLIEVVTTSFVKLVAVSIAHGFFLKYTLGVSVWTAFTTAGMFSLIALCISILIGYVMRRFFNKFSSCHFQNFLKKIKGLRQK